MKKHSKTLSDTGKQQMIEQGMNVVAGLDIGDKHSHVCLIHLDGQIIESKKIRTSQPALESTSRLGPRCASCSKPARMPTGSTASSSKPATNR